jgi:hypothetical protein
VWRKPADQQVTIIYGPDITLEQGMMKAGELVSARTQPTATWFKRLDE